jgi:hypothetical protein
MIDHTLFVPGILDPISASTLTGHLYDRRNAEMKINNEFNRVGLNTASDIMQVKTLLAAAGVDLDSKALTPNEYNWPVSMRYDGIVLLLFLEYSNLRDVSYDLNRIEYSFRAEVVKRAKYSAMQTIDSKDLRKREIWDRHGIRIIIMYTGGIGKFDFQALLLSLVGGLGLMTAATFVIDILATKLLPAKVVYNKFKYEDTSEIQNSLFEISSEEEGSIQSLPIDERTPLVKKEV